MDFILDHFVTFLFILNVFLSLTIVFTRRKDTAQTWAWVLVLAFIPVVGFFLYIFVGRGISDEKIFDLQIQEHLGLKNELEGQKQKLKKKIYPATQLTKLEVDPLIYQLVMYDDALYTTNNQVELFTDGTKKFNALIQDIKQAKHHIHMQYYIYRNDELGRKIRTELVAAAKRGVKVKVLLDGWGSSLIRKKFFNELRAVGGKAIHFFPIFVPFVNPRLNYRNHRKIVVIDGHIGYTGGFNVGDEYLGKVEKFGYWRDNHLRINGEAVYSLQNRFLMDWNSQNNQPVRYAKEYFPIMEVQQHLGMQIVTSGPDNPLEQIKMMYLKMITMANEEILIQTPYYIPDDAIHQALISALLSGIKVHIQIPNKPDHPLVYWATYSFAAELVKFGATVETYEKGFMHAKTMVIDKELVSVGSANIDIRSFQLDFEVNALMYDKNMALNVRKEFFKDSKDSRLLTEERYANRGFWIRIKEGLARLLSPLL